MDVLGCTAELRMDGEAPLVTDNGNFIVDAHTGPHLTIRRTARQRCSAWPASCRSACSSTCAMWFILQEPLALNAWCAQVAAWRRPAVVIKYGRKERAVGL